jgi:hypothetical protein
MVAQWDAFTLAANRRQTSSVWNLSRKQAIEAGDLTGPGWTHHFDTRNTYSGACKPLPDTGSPVSPSVVPFDFKWHDTKKLASSAMGKPQILWEAKP